MIFMYFMYILIFWRLILRIESINNWNENIYLDLLINIYSQIMFIYRSKHKGSWIVKTWINERGKYYCYQINSCQITNSN
jgi:hypothetical protein